MDFSPSSELQPADQPQPSQAPAPSRGSFDREATGTPAESSFESTLKQTSSPETALPAAADAVPSATSEDPGPQPPQRRRTSSFEYSDDGTSQYDSLKLVPNGPNPLSPLFLDLIHAKIREAERQLHFAILANRARDRHDASKRCSCAMTELEYVRQKVLLPPPIKLLEVRILRASALSSPRYGDSILGAKQAESLIQRAFQVLQELIDWGEVKRRKAAAELLEEFLPMEYFNEDDKNEPALETAHGSGGDKADGVDFVEVIVLWYQMLIDHGTITTLKAKLKEQDLSKKIKVENYANAVKLYIVGLQGLTEISQELKAESSLTKSFSPDPEIADYIKSAKNGMDKIIYKMVENWKQDELLNIIQSSSPRLDLTTVQITILKSRQAIDDRKKGYMKRKQEEQLIQSLRQLSAKDRPVLDTKNDGEDDDLVKVTDNGKGKGKGKAVEEPTSDDSDIVTVERVDINKGKGKAVDTDETSSDDSLPSYLDSEKGRAGPSKDEKDDDWVIVQDFLSGHPKLQ